MTAEEQEICIALGNCRYAPGTWDKKFAFSISYKAIEQPMVDLTEAQKEWIYRLLYKYRKQLPRLYNIYKAHPHCQQKKK